MTVDREEEPGLLQTVDSGDGVGYGLVFLKTSWSSSLPPALRLCPVAPSVPPPPVFFTGCFAQGVPLFRAGPASICLAGSQAEAAEALLAEAPGTVPSTTADPDRS